MSARAKTGLWTSRLVSGCVVGLCLQPLAAADNKIQFSDRPGKVEAPTPTTKEKSPSGVLDSLGSKSSVSPVFETLSLQNSQQDAEASETLLFRLDEGRNWMFMDAGAIRDGRQLRKMLDIRNPGMDGDKREKKGAIEGFLERQKQNSSANTGTNKNSLDRGQGEDLADTSPALSERPQGAPGVQLWSNPGAEDGSGGRFPQPAAFGLAGGFPVVPVGFAGGNAFGAVVAAHAHSKEMLERTQTFRKFLDSPVMGGPLSGPADPINAGPDLTVRALNPVTPAPSSLSPSTAPSLAPGSPFDGAARPPGFGARALDDLTPKIAGPSSLSPAIVPSAPSPWVRQRPGMLEFPRKSF
jgi:hypothetical protein